MTDPFAEALQSRYNSNPSSGQTNPYSDPFAEALGDKNNKNRRQEQQEGFLKSSLRSAAQVVQGILETTGPGLAGSFWQLLASGELDHEEMDHLKQVYEKQGKEFPEAEFEEAKEKAMSMIPTVRNLARMAEEASGGYLPLEPKTRFQKGLRFATEATRLSPSGATLRPSNIGLPKPILGAGLEATNEILQEAGLPEEISQPLSFLMLKQPPEGAARITIGAKQKPSGLKERGFESLKEERQVSPKKMGKIDKNIENDFKSIADDLIKSSPVGKTHAELESNPLLKSELGKQFGKIEELADAIPDQIDTMAVKKAIANQAQKKITTKLAPSEYTKDYHSFMKQFIEETPPGTAGAGDLVRSFRSNNEDLRGAYDPVKSKNFNRAKKDAILDYNRAIANVIKEKFPNTEFSKIFPETNKAWSQILDSERINEFINNMFKGEIKYNKIREFLDNPHTNAPFKRALGENYPKFEQLMKDMLSSEKPYKMLQVAKAKGLEDFVETASLFVINPKLSMGKKAIDFAKNGVRFLLNTMLDKPKLTIKWHDAVQNLKKGNFKAAEKDFAFLKSQMEETPKPKEAVKPSEIFNEKKHKENVAANEAKIKKTFFEEPETVEVKGEKIKPESKVKPEEDINNAFAQMGGGIVDNLYSGIFESMEKGKSTFAGMKEPLIAKAKPYYDAGLIKNAKDLREFSNNPKPFEEALSKQKNIKPKVETQENVLNKIEELKKSQPPVESKKPQSERRLLEHKPKENIEDLQVKTEKEKDRSRYSYNKSLETKEGKFIGEITYDKEPDGNIFLSYIQTSPEYQRQGSAKKLLKNLLEENPESKITLSPLQPDEAKLFSKLLEKDLNPSLGKNYEKIGKIKPKNVSLTEKDMRVLKKNLGIENNPTKAEKKAKIDKEAKSTKIKEAKEKKKEEIKSKNRKKD